MSTCVRSIRIPAANAADGNAATRSLPDLLCPIYICDQVLHVATSDPPSHLFAQHLYQFHPIQLIQMILSKIK